MFKKLMKVATAIALTATVTATAVIGAEPIPYTKSMEFEWNSNFSKTTAMHTTEDGVFFLINFRMMNGSSYIPIEIVENMFPEISYIDIDEATVYIITEDDKFIMLDCFKEEDDLVFVKMRDLVQFGWNLVYYIDSKTNNHVISLRQ